MKFNLKTLVAAVAFAGASMSAMAGIQGTGAAGGSELVFYAYDVNAGTSFVRDLGITFDAFLAAPTPFTPVSFAADANWTSYKDSVAGDLSNTQWGVFGAKFTANNAGGYRVLTTATDNLPSVTPQSTGNLQGSNAQFAGFLTNLGDASPVAVNNSYFASAAITTSENWSVLMQNTLGGKLSSMTTTNALGHGANFYQIVRGANNASGVTLSTVFGQAPSVGGGVQWGFDNDRLVIAVPEPETYGLMLAGLALVAGVARRRRA